MPEPFVEGWTGPIDYQLKKGPTPATAVPFNATGMTLTISLRDGRTGAVITPTGTVVWLDATQSTARFTPGATDLTLARSPIGVHFNVVAGADAVSFPRGDAMEWVISRRGGRP